MKAKRSAPWYAPRRARRGSPALRLALALASSCLIALVAVLRAGPPPVVANDAPPEVGSGARAFEALQRLAGGLSARPVGSEANAAVRARLVTELGRLGLEVEVQEAFAQRDERGTVCGLVRNVVARQRGAASLDPSRDEPRQTLLCMAHYDSVGAGPGISDDLAGVAAWLEVARAVRATRPRLARDVIYLFSDAEEVGLLGAEAFLTAHPWASEVGAVINLEARGTDGPSRMFETGADNDWIAAAFARGASRPSATSVSTAIYRRMPNDTDYTVFRQRGIPGLNFAFIGGVSRYHTPLDDLAHLSQRSLQHHVTNALDAVRALDAASWRGPGAGVGDAVFTDVLGHSVALVREDTARALALAAALLALVGVVRGARAGATSGGRVLAGALLACALVGVVGAACFGVGALYEAVTDVARPWRAHPWPALVGFVGAALAATAIAAPLAARCVGAAGLGLGGAVVLGAMTLIAALFAPSASVLLLAPALCAGLGATLARWEDDGAANVGRIGLVTAAVAMFTLAPLAAALGDAFGLAAPLVPGPPFGAALGVLLGLWAMLVAPLLAVAREAPVGAAAAGRTVVRDAAASEPARGTWGVGSVVGCVGVLGVAFGAAMAYVLPATTPETPGHLALVYASDHATGVAEWHLQSSGDPVPAELLALGTFGAPRVPARWSLRNVGAAPAPEGLVAFPEFTEVSVTPTADGTVVRGVLRSRAGGHTFDVRVRGAATLTVEGHELRAQRARLVGVPEAGFALQVFIPHSDLDAQEPGDADPGADLDERPALDVSERVHGAVPASARLAAARPLALVPRQDGDGALLLRSFPLLGFDDDAAASGPGRGPSTEGGPGAGAPR